MVCPHEQGKVYLCQGGQDERGQFFAILCERHSPVGIISTMQYALNHSWFYRLIYRNIIELNFVKS